jgi:transcriptional regulator with XRE-family HTH domain
MAMPQFSRDLAIDFGRVIRDVRVAYGWSQRELARRSRTSQSVISRIECGRAEAFDLAVIGRVFETLGIRMQVRFEVPPAVAVRRERSPGHDRCVVHVARRLQRAGYEVATEVEVGDGRWRAWIDVLAFHPASGLLIVIEVKTELHDVPAEQRRLASYERESWAAARRLGWDADRRISALLLLRTAAIDRVVAANRSLLRLAVPGTAADLLRWTGDPLHAPHNGRALASFDPRARRVAWLTDPGPDARRRPPPYRDYADFVRHGARRRDAAPASPST